MKTLDWAPDYIEKLVGSELQDGEVIESVEKTHNGYGVDYIAMYSNQGVRYLFDYYTHDYLRSEPA